MSQQGNDFYVVKNRETLAELPEWLQDRQYDSVRDGFTDKNGKPMVGLQHRKQKAGLILVLDEVQEDKVIEMARQLSQGGDEEQRTTRAGGL